MYEMDQQELAALYPDGRTFYDETDDQAAFIAQMVDLGFVVQVTYAKDMEPWATVLVPADRLAEFYALDLVVGT